MRPSMRQSAMRKSRWQSRRTWAEKRGISDAAALAAQVTEIQPWRDRLAAEKKAAPARGENLGNCETRTGAPPTAEAAVCGGSQGTERVAFKLIVKFETYEGTSYDFAKIDDSYRNGLMSGIIGFELEIELLEGKFKLGQDRTSADKQSLLKKLGEAKAPRTLREFTAGFYERQGKA